MQQEGGQMWAAEGVPTYQQFRNHAVFVPDITDFALSHKQCNRLMSECGLDFICGLGLGDSTLLYNSVAKNGFVSYDGMCKIFRVFVSRQATVQACVAEENEARAANTHQEAATTSLSFDMPHSWGTDTYSATATGVGAASGCGSYSVHPEVAAFGASGLLGRTPRTIIGQPLTRDTATSLQPKGHQPEESPSSSSKLFGMTALMVNMDPPLMLREIIQPAPCPFRPVNAKFKFARELMNGGQAKIAFGVLKEIPAEWANAVEDKQAAMANKKSAKAAAGAVSAAPVPTSRLPPTTTKMATHLHLVPVEGLLHIYLLTASYAITHNDLALAKQQLDLAESIFDVATMGQEHQYYYLIYMIQGLLHFYEGSYEVAIARLESARNLADVMARDLQNPTARKNTAFCHNNIGVCFHMIGHRAEATKSLQVAVEMLTMHGPGPLALKNSALEVAKANLRRVVRHSFAASPTSTSFASSSASRPSSASPRLMGTTSFSAPNAGGLRPTRLQSAAGGPLGGSMSHRLSDGGSDDRLQRFLRQAITLRTPMAPAALPAWAVRAIPSDKDAKAKKGGKGDKKKDGKKGEKKKKKDKCFTITFGIPEFVPPQYSIANVPAEKKKKKKEKKIPATAIV